jgi:UDP-2,3-diacylglucosamine pyrophosphatase LpxH
MELIVISDLHLSAGYQKKTGKYSRNEDFFFDEEFKRFLEHLEDKNHSNNHLIIAGDMFDFLQVNGHKAQELYQKGGAPFKNEITPRERKYGLGTEEDKTVWKLGVIANGHPAFFEALANFLTQGNHLSIITGNHDIELYWVQVQDAMRREILKYTRGSKADKEEIKDRINFYPWFYYDEEHKTYIEHGNQYDKFNSFQYFLYPVFGPDSEKLWLPLGSFFVRYFFNKLEEINPFADNIKPSTRYMRWAWKENKLQFLKHIYYYLPAMILVFLKRAKLSKAEKRMLAKENDRKLNDQGLSPERAKKIYSLMAPPFTGNRLMRIFTFSTFSFIVIAVMGSIALFAASSVFSQSPLKESVQNSLYSFILMIIPIAKWVLKTFRKNPYKKILVKVLLWINKHIKVPIGSILKLVQIDLVEDILPKIKENLGDVQIIVSGHTHDPDIRKINEDCWYFNTGTWTTVFSEEERIIREAKQFAFVRIKEAGRKPELLRWNDCRGKHERLILFGLKSKDFDRK